MACEFCKTCGELVFDWKPHCCGSIFIVTDEEGYYDEDGKKIYATDFEEAALKFAEHHNTTADYCLMNETMEIKVKNGEGITKKFRIGAEPDIHYSANEIE